MNNDLPTDGQVGSNRVGIDPGAETVSTTELEHGPHRVNLRGTKSRTRTGRVLGSRVAGGGETELARTYAVAEEAEVDLAIMSAALGNDPTMSVQPPSDAEKYLYLRRGRRWVLPVQTLLFAPVVLSLARFALTSAWLYPFLAWVGLQLLSTVIGLWSSNQPRRITFASHRDLVANFKPKSWPSFDVFLPTAGEPLEVLVNTYRHVAALSYPGEVAVHVLDDGDRGDVAAAADRFGFHYVVRPDRGVLKKAGNMRHAFGVSSNDLILVLDADFVPRPDMLSELVPYFEDETIGIVQSPQYFDTTLEQNWLQRCAGATQELFYRWVQPSRDRLGSAICVGTSAIYRRAALNAAGGFAEIEHSEDVHTGIKLRKAGFALRYVPVLLTKGLCPSEFKPFLSQQYRWATGSMSLMKDRSFYRDARLNLKQLLPYFSGFLYYITTGIAVFVATLPGPIMMWFYAGHVRAINYTPYFLAAVVWFVLLPLANVGRWRMEVVRVQMLYSFAHAKALWDCLRGSTAAWVPTGAAKAANPVAVTVMRTVRIVVPLYTLALVSGVLHVALTRGIENVWPAAICTSLYIYVSAPLLLAPRVLSWRDVLTVRRRSPEPEAVTT